MRVEDKSFLQKRLETLKMNRNDIGELMAFCIDNAADAEYVVSLLVESLIDPSTDMPLKIARFYLVSDLLYNSSVSVPHAWKYRGLLQEKLRLVFGHLGWVWSKLCLQGQFDAERFKALVFETTELWAQWMIYADDVQNELKTCFFECHAKPTIELGIYSLPTQAESIISESGSNQEILEKLISVRSGYQEVSIDQTKAFKSKFLPVGSETTLDSLQPAQKQLQTSQFFKISPEINLGLKSKNLDYFTTSNFSHLIDETIDGIALDPVLYEEAILRRHQK